MKQYIGVKLIDAEPMNLGDYNIARGWTIPANEDPKKEGCRVVYPDGYISWSPKDIFDAAYRLTSGMTFGLATELLKQGKKVARKGWNGKGMFIFLDPGFECNGYATFTGLTMNRVNPHFLIKNVDGTLSTWVPSVNDCLAEDWIVVE